MIESKNNFYSLLFLNVAMFFLSMMVTAVFSLFLSADLDSLFFSMVVVIFSLLFIQALIFNTGKLLFNWIISQISIDKAIIVKKAISITLFIFVISGFIFAFIKALESSHLTASNIYDALFYSFLINNVINLCALFCFISEKKEKAND